MMIITKEELQRIVGRAGWSEVVEVALRDGRLPDVIDTDRDQALLESFGLNREELVDRMGGSP
jgi:hypothetical protein